MLDPDHRDALGVYAADDLDQHGDFGVGEAARDFVQQQERRPCRKRAGDFEPLTLQQAEPGRGQVRLAGDPGALQGLGLLQRKRLEIARALATRPTLLLLDEVAGGLTDPEVTVLVEIVRGINAEGITVIWIEHVVRALTSLVGRMLCLYGGQFVGDGDPASVLANPRVREVYLGSDINTSAVQEVLEQEDTTP